MDVAEHELQGLYTWVDEIPLSRPKRNIARDFSDGVLLAEVVHHSFPKLVELHNYSSANGTQQKLYNWNTLNTKVFKRLGFTVTRQDTEACCNCVPGAVERVLKLVKTKIEKYKQDTAGSSTPTGSPHREARVSKQIKSPGYTSSSGYNPPSGVSPNPKQNLFQPPPAVPAPQVIYATPPSSTGSRTPGLYNSEVLAEKDQTIAELRETNEILETKVRKLEQLVRLKDARIQTLMAKLQAAGLA